MQKPHLLFAPNYLKYLNVTVFYQYLLQNYRLNKKQIFSFTKRDQLHFYLYIKIFINLFSVGTLAIQITALMSSH